MLKQSFKTRLRQLWVPAEFRLPEPEFTKEQLDLLEELIQLISPTLSQAESATRDDKLYMANFLVDLGTGIWRIRRKIEGLSRMPKEIRDALYSLESMWMSMSEGGVEIVDHIGTVPYAREAKVVEVREIPNLTREQVVDAIKPTILLNGEVVQLGEVIMGKPISPARAAEIAAFEVDMPEDHMAPPLDEPEIAAEQEPEFAEEETTPAHEVETLTMEPPLRTWAPDTAPIQDDTKAESSLPTEDIEPEPSTAAEYIEEAAPPEEEVAEDETVATAPSQAEEPGVEENEPKDEVIPDAPAPEEELSVEAPKKRTRRKKITPAEEPAADGISAASIDGVVPESKPAAKKPKKAKSTPETGKKRRGRGLGRSPLEDDMIPTGEEER